MGKVDDNKRKKKEQLLKSAYHLFTTQGFNNTSISDIVSHADVAKGTFYLYFKDKFELKDQLIQFKTYNLIIEAGNEAYKQDTQNLEERLLFIINYIVDYLDKDRGLLELISKNLIMGVLRNQLISSSHEVTPIYQRFLDMMENDEYEYNDPEVLLITIVEIAGSTFYNSITYNEPLPLEDYKPFVFRIIRQIIKDFRK